MNFIHFYAYDCGQTYKCFVSVRVFISLFLYRYQLKNNCVFKRSYYKRGNFRVGVIFTFFSILSSSRKFPPCENKTGNRSSIVKIIPTWKVLLTFSQNFPPAKITMFKVYQYLISIFRRVFFSNTDDFQILYLHFYAIHIWAELDLKQVR